MTDRITEWSLAAGVAVAVHIVAFVIWQWVPAAEPQAGAGGLRVALAPANVPVDDRSETQTTETAEPVPPEPVEPRQVEPEVTVPREEPVEKVEEARTELPDPQAQAAPMHQSVSQSQASGPAEEGAGEALALEGANDATAEADYLARLADWLARHQHYPNTARRRGLEGVAEITFTVTRDGGVTDFAVTRSTGYEVLDRAVGEMMERAQPLPDFPAEIRADDLDIVMPVRFELY